MELIASDIVSIISRKEFIAIYIATAGVAVSVVTYWYQKRVSSKIVDRSFESSERCKTQGSPQSPIRTQPLCLSKFWVSVNQLQRAELPIMI